MDTEEHHLDGHPAVKEPEDSEGVAERSFAKAASEAAAVPSERAAAIEAAAVASASGSVAAASSYSSVEPGFGAWATVHASFDCRRLAIQ